MNKFSRFLTGFVTLTLPMMSMAASLGTVADNMLAGVRGLNSVLIAICFVAGVGFCIGGLIQYKYHRDNPQQVRLSTPIVLLVLGVCFISIPLISMLSESSRFVR